MITTIERLKEIQSYYEKATQQVKDIQNVLSENMRPIRARLLDYFSTSKAYIQNLEFVGDNVGFTFVIPDSWGSDFREYHLVPIEALVTKDSLKNHYVELQKKKEEEYRKKQEEAQELKDTLEFERLKKKFGVTL
jgi:hypothetical protein